MKTDQLIRAMAADTTHSRPVSALLPGALLGTAALVGVVFLLLVGPRPDPGAALAQASVLVKQVFPILLAIGGFGAVLRLARPGESVGPWAAMMASVPLILLVVVGAELLRLPPASWSAATMGSTRSFCLLVIPLMSLPILAGSLWVLRRGASTRPALTGAVAGLMSAGTATALYAIHCIEDSPLFYATWYGIGILGITALGALLGARLLRW